jgi:hypothetical protein
MGRGILKRLLDSLDKTAAKLTDRRNEGKGKIACQNSWITDKEIGAENVKLLEEPGAMEDRDG